MKMSVDKMMAATVAVATIIREARPLPQKGAYRLARLHSKLLPEFNTASARRDAMITAYGFHPSETVAAPTAEEPLAIEVRASEAFAVPPEKMAEFAAAWAEIGSEEIDIDVQPVPLAQLDLGDAVPGSISANEFIALGDLVTDA